MSREIVRAGLARELLGKGGVGWLAWRSALFVLLTVGWMAFVAR